MEEADFPVVAFDAPIGEIERVCQARGLSTLVGVDEAGRGPLAGPVYAAAVVLDPTQLDAAWLGGLDDSKKLTASRREALAVQIREHAMAWSVCWRDERTIDDINILQATFAAMGDAVEEVVVQLGAEPSGVLIDGNQLVPMLRYTQQPLVKGDSRSLSIAAASILAKVERDALMCEHHEAWPEYGFAKHKGYGTKAHREAIATWGPCPVHRLSFAGVREHGERLRPTPS